ncbi:MAG: ribosomal-protein-alanine N-acetyltransferase [Clostridiales bacterium]|nr:ribosomal-protein-alanine N-acetyltransferase [Clostridiales bacterium]
MTNFTLRDANIEDIKQIYLIDSLEKDSYSLDTISSMVASDTSMTIVVEDMGRVIGYIHYSIALDEAELIKIVVSGDYRRQGIASRLLSHTSSILKEKGVKIVFLEVRIDNDPAKNLYEKNGFVHYFTREKYYNGIDAMLYRLKLNEE